MFWKFNLLTTSHVDTLLDRENVTLHELMDEPDILQECKAQNRKLITFLVEPENMEELVKLITEEPEEDMDEKVKYKYPNTACELLTSDVSQINDALGTDELVNKLYGFLDTETTPLNPLLASFFSKVMGLIITRKSEMILEFLKAKEDFVGLLLKHIGTSAIMDLLLRLLTCIESPEIRRAMIEWLNDQKIVKRLVTCITSAYDEDIHCNAAQSLCDIIRLGREQVIQLQDRADQDPLLASIEQEDTVSELLENMLAEEKSESVIVNGLSVIQTLLECKRQGPEDSGEQMLGMEPEKMFTGANSVLTAICPRLKDFHNILTDPPKQRFTAMPSTVGSLDPPLGNTRIQTSRLIASLLIMNTHSINQEISQLGTISVLLELYFKYVWNNFLHTHVTQCIYTILTNPAVDVEGQKECPLLNQLFTDVKILEKIIEEWECNDADQCKGGRRRGFMGHLTRLANDIVNAQEKGENVDTIKSLVDDLSTEVKERWEAFLAGTLAETNKKNTTELVRAGHALASSSEDDDADFSNIPFPQDTAMQQLQQMTSNFIDQFGFNEEEFGEQDEKTDSPFTDRISSIDFTVSVNDDRRVNASMFEQTCNERLQPLDDSDEDIWEEKEITFSPTSTQNKRSEVNASMFERTCNERLQPLDDSDEDIWEEKEITFSPTSTQNKRSDRLPVSGYSETGRNSNDSEDSTDSEDELESPKKIAQAGVKAERMDIDSNEAWVANFENPPDVGPIAMDTSPWDNEAQSTETNTEKWAEFTNKVSQEEMKDNWADFSNFSDLKDCWDTSPWDNEAQSTETNTIKWAEFTNKVSQEEMKDNWADFSNFSDLKDVKSEPRSSSPVAMDTTEPTPSSRTNAYLADSKEDKEGQQQQQQSDIKLESIDSTSSSVDIQSSDNKHTDNTSETQVKQDNTDNSNSVVSSTEEPSSDTNDGQKEASPANSQSESVTVAEADSSTSPEGSSSDDKPPTPPSNPPPDEDSEVPQSPRSPSSSNPDCDQTSPAPGDTQAQGDGTLLHEGSPPAEEGSEQGDLSDNFNFLTKVGLMKQASPSTEVDTKEIQGNGPTSEDLGTSVDKIEDIRNQAKDALESYDSAIKTGASVQNGPV